MNFIDRPTRSLAQAQREAALHKALHLQPMTDDELRRLTDAELNDIVARTRHNQEVWEADNTCYVNGGGVRVRQLTMLRVGANAELRRRADISTTCPSTLVAE